MKESKRIVICATNYLPHVGGAEIAVDHIATHLSQKGYEFDLIAPRLTQRVPKHERIGTVSVYRVGFGFSLDKFLLPFLGLWRYKKLAQQYTYDIVWSLMASQGSVLASFIAKKYGVPLVLTLQEGDEEMHLSRYVGGSIFLYNLLIKPWHTMVFRYATRITVISQYLKKRAEQYSDASISIVPNGVDVDAFTHPDPERVQHIQDTYNLSGKRVVVSVSRLVKKNNCAVLIRALTHLPQNVVLMLVGDGEEKNALKILARARAVEDRVIFAGRVLPQDVPAYMHAGHVFARVPISEGMGNVFVEAFAAGVPVIASPVGGITDIIEDRHTGLLVSPHDEEAVAAAIETVLTDQYLREHIVLSAKARSQEYRWEKIALSMKNVFDMV